MPSIGEGVSRIVGAQVRSPKTILGFFAIVLGILATGAVIVVVALARTPSLHHLIVPILLFVAILIVVVLVGVFITSWKDPTILMLGEISGTAYIENRRLSLGDSLRGERMEEIHVVTVQSGGHAQLSGGGHGNEQAR